MRKVIIIFCLVAALVAMTVPAFAVGVGRGSTYYAPITFDTIHMDGIGIYDYPLNWIDSASSRDNMPVFYFEEYIYGEAMCDFSNNRQYLFADFACPTTTIDLRSELAFIQPRYLENADYTISFLDCSGHFLQLTTVDIYFELVLPFDYPDGKFEYRTTTCERSFLDFEDGTFDFDIGQSISDIIYDQILWDDGYTTACIKNLRIDFNFEMYDQSTPHLWVRWYGSLSSEENDFNIFIREGGQKYLEPQPEPNFDFSTWLSDSVGAFLEFELFPGFSIDMIFWLFLVIFILLWFIKLVR